MRKNLFQFIFLFCCICLLLNGTAAAYDSEDPTPLISASMDDDSGSYTEFTVTENETESNEIETPFIPEGITSEEIPPYTIFGPDDRAVIKYSPTNFPYTAVVKLYTEWDAKNGTGTLYNTCSGFMIGPNYAATAAHCIFAPKSGYAKSDYYEGWAKSVKVCPAASDTNEPFGCAYATQKTILDVDVREEYDVAVLKLSEPLGNKSGWMGSYILSDSECNSYAQLLGYALDHDMKYMFYSTGYLEGSVTNGKELKYRLDTLKGSSGGPVIISYKDQWGYLVGINVSSSSEYNYAVRLTNQVYDFLGPYWGK